MADSGIWHLIRQGGSDPFVVSGDVIVGRSKQSDLRIEEGYVSRRHARLWIEAGRLMVEDLGSANGTFLNGERLARSRCLSTGDRVCFDETEFFVEAVAERSDADPNATAHRPDEDPDFQKPDRPEGWQPPAAVPVATREPAPPPPPRSTGPTPPTEDDFDLGIADFDLTGSNDAAAQPSRPPPPEPPPIPLTTSDFDLNLTGELGGSAAGAPDEDAPLDLSIGSARPEGTPAATIVMDPDSAPAAPVPGTVVMTPEEVPRGSGAASGAGTSGAASGLLFLSGPEEGVLYELAEGRVRIGRAAESDIRIDESSVSKRHAELRIEPGNCRIYDTSNSNGVFVNGNQVDDVVLNPGDVIRLGRIEIMFDAYDKLVAGGVDGNARPWIWLVASFVGTVALAAAAYFGLQFI